MRVLYSYNRLVLNFFDEVRRRVTAQK